MAGIDALRAALRAYALQNGGLVNAEAYEKFVDEACAAVDTVLDGFGAADGSAEDEE